MKKFRPTRTYIGFVAYQYCSELGMAPRPATAPATPALDFITQGPPMSFPTTATLPEDETMTGEPAVVDFMLGQLSRKTPARPAPLIEDEASNDATIEKHGERAVANARLRRLMAERLITARGLSGLGQGQAAKVLGLGNQTQLALYERADRLPTHVALLELSRLYGCSIDFLYGISQDPDRDGASAARNAEVSRVQGLLEANARAVAGVLLDGIRVDSSANIRATHVLATVADLCDGLDRFYASNQDLFDEARGGALMLRRCREARESLEKVVGLLDAADRRTEHALLAAREAMARA